MASSLQQSLETACQDGTIPGAVVVAANRDGILYSEAFGVDTLSPDVTARPLKTDAVMYIASCTKLLASIAALQCVDRGLVKLEDDVTLLLPELASLKILTGVDDAGQPTFKSRTNPITLSNLLTHSSGLGYPGLDPTLTKYVASVPNLRLWDWPLVYEPGTSWSYSCSIDWVGKLVETLTGKSLEVYFQDNILSPLGIHDITFWPDTRPDMKARMMGTAMRDPQNKLVFSDNPLPFEAGKITSCFAGHGAFATVPDYTKVLHSLLADDEKLVSKKTREIMFRGHLGPESRAALQAMCPAMIGYPPELQVDWGFGGVISLNDMPDGSRKAGTMAWGGQPNLTWFIDPAAGLCGLFGTQVIPTADKRVQDVTKVFEKAMYDIANAAKR